MSGTLPVDPVVQADIVLVQAALALPGAFSQNSEAWYAAVAVMQTLQGAVENVITTADNDLGGVAGGASPYPGILGTTRTAIAIANVADFTTYTGNLAGALMQQAYINRAAVNLQNSGT